MPPKRVIIKASDVAACIGRHRYKPRDEVLNDMWKKYWPDAFTGQTKSDRAEQALEASPVIREVFKKTLEIQAVAEAEVQKEIEEVRVKVNSDPKLSPTQKTEVIEKAKTKAFTNRETKIKNEIEKVRTKVNSDPKLSQVQKAEVIEHVRSKVSTTHGIRNEDQTADTVTEKEGARLSRDEAFYDLDVCTIDGIPFCVTGRVDRIEECPDGSRVLVEIKNRMNRLFRSVPEYENIQIQVYLRMLGLGRARLVEQYNTQVLSHDVTRDDAFWEGAILPGLKQFCQDLYTSASA